MAEGRGAWTKKGMPENGTGYYKLLYPIHVGTLSGGINNPPTQDQRAVNYGVKAIQKYVNALFALHDLPSIKVDGIFGPTTDQMVKVAQYVSGLKSDGTFGPTTARAFFWPTIKAFCAPDREKAIIAGGICSLESAFDPGAVGSLNDSDKGLAQINIEAHPHIKVEEAFGPKFALKYLVARVTASLTSFTNPDAAIMQYNSPLWAEQWEKIGHAPNEDAAKYVRLVKAFKPPA